MLCYVMLCSVCYPALFCYGLSVLFCYVMFCYVCYYVLFCSVMLCSSKGVFCRVCRGREAGPPGPPGPPGLPGQSGVWRPRYAGWVWPGGQFLKSNDPNLSGGEKSATISRMEGGTFSKFGSRLSAAHIRLSNLQQLQGWGAARFQTWALALAPRTFDSKDSNSFKDGGRVLFKIRLWGACFSRARVQV